MASISVSFKSLISKLSYLNTYHLTVPKSVIKKLGGSLNIRLICTVNKKVSFSCGLMALGDGLAYISIHSKRIKDAGTGVGEEVSVSLVMDDSKYGMEMPEELQEILEQDEVARLRFEKITPGKQRNIIRFVSSVKNSQLRIDRAWKLLTNLKSLPPGKESNSGIFGMH